MLQDVYKSESDTNQRNQAIGALMCAYGYIKDNWQQAVDLHASMLDRGKREGPRCHGGDTGVRRPEPGHRQAGHGCLKVPGVLAVMATAGLCDDSGKWLYHTGLPGKSGVGGGIIAVSPGKFGIAVVSPRSMRPATASALKRRSPTFPQRSTGTRTQRKHPDRWGPPGAESST